MNQYMMEDLFAKIASGGCVVVAAWHAGMASLTQTPPRLFGAAPIDWLPDPNVIQTWGAMAIGGVIYVWNEWRKSKRQVKDDKLLDEQKAMAHRVIKKIYQANLQAIEEGKPVPFPDFLPDHITEPINSDEKGDGK